MTPILEVERVSKRFGKFTALNDVSAAMQLLATGAIIVIAAALQTYVVGHGGGSR